MARKSIHVFSEGGLHGALLAALLMLIVVGLIDSWFFTPEGKTPVLWRLDPVVVSSPSPSR